MGKKYYKKYYKKHRGSKIQKAMIRSVVKSMDRKVIEVKRWTRDFANTVSTTAGLYDCIAGIAQGLDNTERIGNEITVKSITLRGIVYITPTTGDAFNHLRMTLFQWHQDNVVAPPDPNVIWQTAFYVAGHGYYAPYNLEQKPKYHIIKDKTFTLTRDNNGSLHFLMKFSGKFVRNISFDQATGLPVMNGIYIYWQSDSGVVVHPGFAMSVTVDYTDA